MSLSSLVMGASLLAVPARHARLHSGAGTRAQVQSARQARPKARADPNDASPPPSFAPWEAVEFSFPGTHPSRLGRVVEAAPASTSSTITLDLLVPLENVEAYDGSATSAWGVDEAAGLVVVPATTVLWPRADLEYAQRANPSRVADPHGEHAVEVWLGR
jgi:hypothetical protein